MKRVLFAVLAAASLARAAEPVQVKTLPLGADAPGFSLPAVDGKTYALKDFAAARALVVVFTCVHCPTAILAQDRIKQLVTDYRDKGVALVAISSSSPKGARLDEFGWTELDDSFASMKIRAKQEGYNYPYLYDGDEPQAVCQAYGPVATPHFFVFDAARKLRYEGRLDDDERGGNVKTGFVRDAIDAVLAGRDPAVARTKVVGCSTKWFTKEPQVKAFMERLAAEPVTLAKADEAALKELRENKSGKVRLVNFWATWCAPCIVEFPDFVETSRMYRTRQFEFVSVSVNKPEEEGQVLAFLKKQQASNRNLIFASDDRDRLMEAFDKEWQGAVPFTVVLAPDGRVVYRQTDSVDPLELRRAILKELNAHKPW